MSLPVDDLRARASRVRLLLLDVDGVLTDGTVTIAAGGADAGESKTFSIRDGAAIVWAGRCGVEIGLLSGRPSDVTTRRAAELGLTIVAQGPVAEKAKAYERILASRGLSDEDVGYMADDILDLPVLLRAGFSAAPADAVDEVRARVHWVSRHGGGRGAVRELVELLLTSRGAWDTLVRSYLV